MKSISQMPMSAFAVGRIRAELMDRPFSQDLDLESEYGNYAGIDEIISTACVKFLRYGLRVNTFVTSSVAVAAHQEHDVVRVISFATALTAGIASASAGWWAMSSEATASKALAAKYRPLETRSRSASAGLELSRLGTGGN